MASTIEDLLGTLGMKDARKKFAYARRHPKGFDKDRFNEASEPVTSDTGVPDKLIERMKARQKDSYIKDYERSGR